MCTGTVSFYEKHTKKNESRRAGRVALKSQRTKTTISPKFKKWGTDVKDTFVCETYIHVPSPALGQRACKFCLPNQGQQEARSTGFQSRMPVYVSTFSTVKFKFKIGLYMSEDVDFYS